MLSYPDAGFNWPEPWQPITDEPGCLEFPRIMASVFGGYDAASSLPAELQRECCPTHPLSGRTCIPVAATQDDPNEFLFITDHPEYPIVFVHLTWAVESDPIFPHIVGYHSWEAFKLAWPQRQA